MLKELCKTGFGLLVTFEFIYNLGCFLDRMFSSVFVFLHLIPPNICRIPQAYLVMFSNLLSMPAGCRLMYVCYHCNPRLFHAVVFFKYLQSIIVPLMQHKTVHYFLSFYIFSFHLPASMWNCILVMPTKLGSSWI
jgi:hypothetical protein